MISQIITFFQKKAHYLEHRTKRSVLVRFVAMLAIALGYFGFVSWHYGAGSGLVITFLTWSFFVLCTPVADGGILIDFPVRFLTGWRMMYTEALNWGAAVGLNIYFLLFNASVYEQTGILRLAEKIYTQPWPFWGIILLSLTGTFLSVYFGDELIDVAHHHQREKHARHKSTYYWVVLGFFFVAALALYQYLLSQLGVGDVLSFF